MQQSTIRTIIDGVRENSEPSQITEIEFNLATVLADAYEELLKVLTPQQLILHNKFYRARENAFLEESNSLYSQGV